ncbi:MAG: DUF5721 family protein [Defluviitaleaceae bacterium]|nr:DUF5721 family protein [Defluviitaleaceae bacterium]
MLSLSIVDVKGFMAKLLKEDVFDGFDLHTLNIQSFASFEVYKVAEEEPPKWGVIKPYAFDFVKGGKTPKAIKLVLSSGGEGCINIYFEESKTTITTGFAQKTFTMDKSQARMWEEDVLQFLQKANIEYINEMEA